TRMPLRCIASARRPRSSRRGTRTSQRGGALRGYALSWSPSSSAPSPRRWRSRGPETPRRGRTSRRRRRSSRNAEPRQPERAEQRLGACGDELPQVLGLDDDGLAEEPQDLADQPLCAPDLLLHQRSAVDELLRTALDLPARDVLRVDDPRDT